MIRVQTFGISAPVKCGRVLFSPDLPFDQVDGMLAYQKPHEALLTFRGPKAWYCIESTNHSAFRRKGLWRELRDRLSDQGFLHFSNPNQKFRVPHYTTGHDEHRLYYANDTKRENVAVAVVSSFGGPYWRVKPAASFRTRSILCESIRIYGAASSWEKFRKWGVGEIGPVGPPTNYCGAPPVQWHSTVAHYRWLSNFKAILCLENRCEPYYFTEKFPAAVMAGAVPIYHPHPTVQWSYLQNAKYINPSDYGYDMEVTVRAALDADITAIQKCNEEWLKSLFLTSSTRRGIFNRIAGIFVQHLVTGDAHV